MVWVKLLRIPTKLWNKEVMKALGNDLGKFINLEVEFHTKVDRKVIKKLFGNWPPRRYA